MKLVGNPVLLATILVAGKVARAMDFPVICMSSPVVPLYPGLAVAARLDSQGKRCEAILTFSNSDFFPVHFEFDPMNDCLGYQGAEFIVPEQVPNGDAFILWRCADQMSPTCTKAMISGGSGDANGIDFNQSGAISCVFPVATQTTLSTVIEPSTTFAETATTTIFSTSILGPNSTSGPNSPVNTPASTPVETTILTSTVSAPSTTFTETITSTFLSTSSSLVNTLASTPVETTIITSTVSAPSTTFTETITSTILSNLVVGRNSTSISASVSSPEVETLVSTSIDGNHTAVTTFTSTVFPTRSSAGSQSMATPISVLTSLLTLTITAPCSKLL